MAFWPLSRSEPRDLKKTEREKLTANKHSYLSVVIGQDPAMFLMGLEQAVNNLEEGIGK